MTAAYQAGAARESFPWGLVLALALAQLVAWGTLYYAFAIVMAPMGAELGWSKAAMNGALSLGLAVTGVAAVGVGRWIDRHGGRTLMTVGSLIGAVLLILWSQVTALWQLYAIWVGIGLVSATVLYEPVFAVVARVLPNEYRRAITTITLLGGLASTAFIPLTQGLVDLLGWRHALLVLAAIELPLCAGIPWLLLRGRETRPMAPASPAPKPGTDIVRRAMAHSTFWLLVATFVCTTLLHTALLFNLVPMLGEHGLTIGEAVAVYAVIGPAQVAGRVALLTLERVITVSIAGLVGAVCPSSRWSCSVCRKPMHSWRSALPSRSAPAWASRRSSRRPPRRNSSDARAMAHCRGQSSCLSMRRKPSHPLRRPSSGRSAAAIGFSRSCCC
jgi:MFS family permease